MPKPPKTVKASEPATWPKPVWRAVDAIAAVLMTTCLLFRSRAAAHPSPTIRAFGERDERAWNEALLQREVDMLRGRLESMPPQHRPHYAPKARFAILQLMRLRHWSIEQAAHRFVLHANTIRSWLREFNAGGPEALFGKAPFNKISDAGRWLVHQIRELIPDESFGTRAIAMAIARAGTLLSRSSVQRILRENKPQQPPAPAQRTAEPDAVVPDHILRPTEINRTWHLDLTTLEFLWIRFYVAAVVDGFSRRLLALKVYRDAPSARNMIALVERCVREFGTPRFIVTDHGTQFRRKFKRAMAKKPLQIDVIKGSRDRSKQFNGKAERFFKSFRLWQRLTLFARKKDWIQRRLDIFRAWFNTQRPMWLHGGRTPEEVWSDTSLPPTRPLQQNDRLRPAVTATRVNFRGDCHLPTLNIRIVRTVKRTA